MFRGCFLIVLTFVFGIVLLLTTSVGFIVFGIPSFSSFVVDRLPRSVDKEVGKEVRSDILKHSKIDTLKSRTLCDFYLELGFDSTNKLYVIESKENDFNAFALPDNSIFVYDQVIKDVESYEELSALLAHEYTHIAKRHGMKSLASSLSNDLIFSLLSGSDNKESFTKNAGRLLNLKNSRKYEREADRGGLDLLLKHEINPIGFTNLFNRMIAFDEGEKHIPTYLSTHPNAEDRLDEINIELSNKKVVSHGNHRLEQLFQILKNQ